MEFRVSVCLTRYYSDERSYCYIYLDKSYEKISTIECYLRQLFRLKGDFCLMINNYLLPSEQPSKIIGCTDTVTVVPLQKHWCTDAEVVDADPVEVEPITEQDNLTVEVAEVAGEKIGKKKKKKKTKPETAEPTVSTEDELTIVKKDEPVSPTPSTERNEKKDSDMDVSMGSDADRDEEPALTEEVHDDNESDMEEPRASDVQSAIQQLKLKALSLLSEASMQRPAAGVSGGRINKRKRIRKRNKNASLSMSTPDLTDSPAAVPLTFKPLKKSASHIRFENDPPLIIQKPLRNSEGTIKPRIIHAVENRSVCNSRRTSESGVAPAESVSTSSNNVCSQPINIVNVNSKVDVATKNTKVTVDSMKKRLSEFPVMDNVYPVPKDLILFKMLKIGSDYLPGVSDYILASVLEVDKDKDTVKVSVLDGRSECLPPSGKFDLEPLPETSLDEDLILDVTWGHVVEPRLVFP